MPPGIDFLKDTEGWAKEQLLVATRRKDPSTVLVP